MIAMCGMDPCGWTKVTSRRRDAQSALRRHLSDEHNVALDLSASATWNGSMISMTGYKHTEKLMSCVVNL